MAAAAVTLRWGSYLAVLLDRDKPLWSAAARPDATSRISDEEMARINIEASAALAEWIDLYRASDAGRNYTQLVDRAVSYLPMPRKTSKPKAGPLAALADPETGVRLMRATDPARVARVGADTDRHPSRLFANALVNVAWRNGPVENVHAGRARRYPLEQRRMTPAEGGDLMRFASDRMAMGMAVCRQLATEQPRRPWAEQVLPFGLAHLWLVTPPGWTLTENSYYLSRLNHAACTLPVYASQRGSLRHHATLGAGWWPTFAGRDWVPAGLRRKVSEIAMTSLPPFPGFAWRTSSD